MRKELWSPEEDEKLKQYILQHGYHSWTEVPIKAGLRRGCKSCRLRWINYLRPGLRRCKFSDMEIKLVMDLHKKYGNRWSKIASQMEGRTDNGVKNIWNSVIRRHQKSTINNNQNHVKPLPEKSLCNSISYRNETNSSSYQDTKEERQDLVTNNQVLNMLPRSFPFSLDPMPIHVPNNYGNNYQHDSCLLENPIKKLLTPKSDLISIHNVEQNKNIHIDRTPKLEFGQELSISIDMLPIKRSNYSCDSVSLINTNEDQVEEDENIKFHLPYPWSWYNSEGEINDIMDHNDILMKDDMGMDYHDNFSITTSHYQIPPIPPKMNPSYLVSPILYPINQLFHHHDIEDMYYLK